MFGCWRNKSGSPAAASFPAPPTPASISKCTRPFPARGEIPHPPHQRVNEETIVIVEGTIDVFIAGKTETATADSVTFFASNDLHNFRNVGPGPCRYYVLELRADAA